RERLALMFCECPRHACGDAWANIQTRDPECLHSGARGLAATNRELRHARINQGTGHRRSGGLDRAGGTVVNVLKRAHRGEDCRLLIAPRTLRVVKFGSTRVVV